jgi:hypothetical protein
MNTFRLIFDLQGFS